MAIYSRYEPHRKKKSGTPWFLLIFLIILGSLGYFYRKEIFFLFARDQSVRAEKAKEKLIELWKSDKLKESDIEDFQTVAVNFSEKDPTDPQAFHLIARSLYWNLPRIGIFFDSSSLVLNLGSDFSEFIGKTQLAESTLDSIFWNARTAEAVAGSSFSDWENNRLLLFLTETYRHVKRPGALTKDYGSIDTSKLSPEFQSVFIWLLTYNTMQAGDAQGLEKILDATKKPGYAGRIQFSPREENFLKGMSKFYKKDYVNSLSLLRSTKTANPDKITETAVITEANIFHMQNLTQKGIDLLEEYYSFSGKKNEEILNIIRVMLKERPTAKTKLDVGLSK
ncbi:hypothetical protein [Leptospira ilyithenensis]|uniref:hypothetical protein n=1 Tax=Leptospira ilyithenensis TaxID=2484901 RepID=UPI001FE8246D|nr:hypothetical protein [Leptospira ilyithenensis]